MSENRPLTECFTVINSKLIPKYLFSKGTKKLQILEEIKAMLNKLKSLFIERKWANYQDSINKVNLLLNYIVSIKNKEFDNKIRNDLNSLILSIEKQILGE